MFIHACLACLHKLYMWFEELICISDKNSRTTEPVGLVWKPKGEEIGLASVGVGDDGYIKKFIKQIN